MLGVDDGLKESKNIVKLIYDDYSWPILTIRRRVSFVKYGINIPTFDLYSRIILPYLEICAFTTALSEKTIFQDSMVIQFFDDNVLFLFFLFLFSF